MLRKNQKVACIKTGAWDFEGCGPVSSGPAKGDVCVISLIVDNGEYLFLQLVGYPKEEVFLSTHFKPIVDNSTRGSRGKIIDKLRPARVKQEVM
jgi:hypothetical protein